MYVLEEGKIIFLPSSEHALIKLMDAGWIDVPDKDGSNSVISSSRRSSSSVQSPEFQTFFRHLYVHMLRGKSEIVHFRNCKHAILCSRYAKWTSQCEHNATSTVSMYSTRSARSAQYTRIQPNLWTSLRYEISFRTECVKLSLLPPLSQFPTKTITYAVAKRASWAKFRNRVYFKLPRSRFG